MYFGKKWEKDGLIMISGGWRGAHVPCTHFKMNNLSWGKFNKCRSWSRGNAHLPSLWCATKLWSPFFFGRSIMSNVGVFLATWYVLFRGSQLSFLSNLGMMAVKYRISAIDQINMLHPQTIPSFWWTWIGKSTYQSHRRNENHPSKSRDLQSNASSHTFLAHTMQAFRQETLCVRYQDRLESSAEDCWYVRAERGEEIVVASLFWQYSILRDWRNHHQSIVPINSRVADVTEVEFVIEGNWTQVGTLDFEIRGMWTKHVPDFSFQSYQIFDIHFPPASLNSCISSSEVR